MPWRTWSPRRRSSTWTSCDCRVPESPSHIMFIELVDALRCPVPHEESWLVASATRMEARHIVDGLLGCPVCHAEYPIRNGVADFRREPTLPLEAAPDPFLRGDATTAMRLAAFLGLSDADRKSTRLNSSHM